MLLFLGDSMKRSLAIKIETTEDILELMNGSIYAAVLGTAMELGIFWLLSDKPLSTHEISQQLNIPVNRCNYLLQILGKLGLLERSGDVHTPSALAQKVILDVQSQDTWVFQAREDRDLALYVQDLALNISKPIPARLAAKSPDIERQFPAAQGRYRVHSTFYG
jgi:hypothetical protein